MTCYLCDGAVTAGTETLAFGKPLCPACAPVAVQVAQVVNEGISALTGQKPETLDRMGRLFDGVRMAVGALRK